MRDQLAERLLARVMGWSPEDVARERPVLQAMADYKYDEYQQFSPGIRFVESFALCLSGLKTSAEKEVFYNFVKTRLIFFSAAEINHLVSIAYPDFVRPRLLRKVAQAQGLNPYHVAKVAGTKAFRIRERECLFLGLSDGAQTDAFRRSSSPHIGHEQVLQSYEISLSRVDKLLESLRTDVAAIQGRESEDNSARFSTVVLLDDFSASGTSYLRRKEGLFKGKIGDFHRDLTNSDNPMSKLVNLQEVQILLVLYLATEQACSHLRSGLEELWGPHSVSFEILVVHPLDSDICLRPGQGNPIEKILETYYDEKMEDEHTREGKTDLKFGYAHCGLPLVLSHNTPNNSIYPLWSDKSKLRPLFPRVSRHKEA
jgi:hypothetical protein